jgi:hypothetical protein
MSTENEDRRTDVKAAITLDVKNKEKALDTAMKLGTQCSRTIESVIENSNQLYKFLNEKQ